MMKPIVAACLGVILSGCTAFNATRVDSAGVPVQSEDGFQVVDLALALNPLGFEAPSGAVQKCIMTDAQDCAGVHIRRKPELSLFSTSVAEQAGEDDEEIVERLRLETAYYAFYNDARIPGDAKDRRNRVQDRLISASDMNCGIFVQRIYRVQGSANFLFGSSATVMGGAGAIVTDVGSARLLSGLSSIFSGVRAEMNEDFFRKQWIEALAKAIENERSRLRREIDAQKAKSIEDYTVEAAVAEALRYNDACSLVSGLKEVNRAVAIADDPAGLRAFRDSYARAGFDAQFSATLSSAPADSTTRLRPSTATASVALAAIATGMARFNSLARDSKTKLAYLPDDQEAKAVAEIDKVAAGLSRPSVESEQLTTEAGTSTNPAAPLANLAEASDQVAPFAHELTTLRDEYAALMVSLARAGSDEERTEYAERMEANDAAAGVLWRAADNAISAAMARVAKIVADAPSLEETASGQAAVVR